tara:strand:+ start:341 stop:523 length:183 start_codon:yes stop_codon:yes gene_type:complete
MISCKGITNDKIQDNGCETITKRALKYVINDKSAKKTYAYSITELIHNQKKSFDENNKLK